MKIIQIYLSSTDFGFFDFKNKNWKNEFIQYMNMQSSVFYGKDISFKFIDPLKIISDEPQIVTKDLNEIKQSDFIVVYLPKKLTIGTMMELSYSVMKQDRNRVIVIDKSNVHKNHPWIKYWVNSWCVCHNENHAAYVITQFINENLVNEEVK